jgi:arylsulfatase A
MTGHLGQQPQYLPTAHGFDSYYGIPYSDDMGSSAWDMYNNSDRPPLPLISSNSPEQMTILEQPTNLNLLSSRYVKESVDFIASHSKQNKPWFLYMAFNHVHVPDFASPLFCNSTKRGLFGDALAELDTAVGNIVDSVVEAGVDNNTIIFFTSDNGPWLIKGLSGGSAGLLKDGKETTWEGGVREPGIIRWTGKIQPGRISRQVVATYDIFATSIVLSGGAIPTDRIIDGVDLSPLLFDPQWEDRHHEEGSSVLHPCLYHYKGTPNLQCPAGHPNCPGLWAVRCGPYKLHYVTSNYLAPRNGVFHDPPLIYHIEHDPSEKYPLLASSTEYKNAQALIQTNVVAHQKNLRWVPPQMAKGKDPSLKICCTNNASHQSNVAVVEGGGGGVIAPCVCNPENFHVFVCSDPSIYQLEEL